MTETPAPAAAPRALRLRALRLAGSLALVAGAGAATAALAAVLHDRPAEAVSAATPAALPVEVVRAEFRDSHAVETRHLGRIEAARSVALAFELGGTVAAVGVEEGDRVAPGAVLARLDSARLEARRAELEAEIDALAAREELARRTLARQESLREAGHATAQRLDEARLERDSLAASRARAEAALIGVEVELAKTALRAPFAGQVAARHLDEGAVAAPGAPALELVEVSRPRLRLGLPARLAARLAPGDSVPVRLADGTVTARIAAIRPDLDPATRTRAVLLALDLPEGAAPAFGETAEALIADRRESRGAWLPLSALREGERGLWTVLVAEPTPAGGFRAAAEAVEVLHVAGDRAYVRGSLAEGARVLAAGPHRVVPGDPVDPRPAAERPAPDGPDLAALAN